MWQSHNQERLFLEPQKKQKSTKILLLFSFVSFVVQKSTNYFLVFRMASPRNDVASKFYISQYPSVSCPSTLNRSLISVL
jgi:hypothetical protein